MFVYQIKVEYLGTNFAGWQIQKNGITVQGILEKSLSKYFKKNISVIGSGRTDSGVHATEQSAHFRLNKKREVRGISGKRFKEVKKDLRNFRYDEIVEDHLYRTLIGQEIWLKLGFPYIVDKKLD